MLLLIAAAVAGLFAVMTLIEKRGLLDEQFGDSGEWKKDDDTELFFGDREYVSKDDIDTYLIMGTDGGGDDLGEAYRGDLADFLILVVTDNTTGKYAMYQIDRNTMVEMEICDEKGNFNSFATQQICIAHWYGLDDEARNANTMSAVSILMGGLGVDHFYSISMDDIGKINHALGGVPVKVETDITEADPAFTKGAELTLSDEQAEKFVRARLELKDDTNAARMSRQRQYLQNMRSIVMGRLKDDPDYINKLFSELGDVIQTDCSEKQTSVLTNHILEYDDQGFIGFEGETKLADTQGDGVEHEEFYVDEQSIIDGLRKVMHLDEAAADKEDKGNEE